MTAQELAGSVSSAVTAERVRIAWVIAQVLILPILGYGALKLWALDTRVQVIEATRYTTEDGKRDAATSARVRAELVALDQRCQRIEAKQDRILERLEDRR